MAEAISKARKGCAPWNKGLTEETDALITVTLDEKHICIESLPQSRKGDSGENTTVDTVKRKVSCETEGRYQFCLARKHLQEALNGSDNIMHVGEGVVLFEKKDYKHMVPTCANEKHGLGYLVKH